MRRCRYCKEHQIPKDAPKSAFTCSPECALAYVRKRTQSQSEAKERALGRERREYSKEVRAKLKTLSEWVTDAQGWVNKVVVAEDKPLGCISCDSPLVTEAGHYFHRGSKYRIARLTLDRRNLNGQCGHCNRWQGGKQHEYRIGFIARYGEAAFGALCELKRQTDCGEIKSLTIEDCQSEIAKAKARLKELKR